ncbi:hypothetical protein RB12075 [Rhodopirellula baltica SH 1]|uniref:Uncharacterized protein n=1 Tax=Rhodopirellula baltica (strain DSM 10527 / NCIMB 13988 / SH1) TaxID=243090 RepID=Q7UJ77_RHOBA|nr:hypothetical protein RB12075 [Rhodopirellula baltica SH 1]
MIVWHGGRSDVWRRVDSINSLTSVTNDVFKPPCGWRAEALGRWRMKKPRRSGLPRRGFVLNQNFRSGDSVTIASRWLGRRIRS